MYVIFYISFTFYQGQLFLTKHLKSFAKRKRNQIIALADLNEQVPVC